MPFVLQDGVVFSRLVKAIGNLMDVSDVCLVIVNSSSLHILCTDIEGFMTKEIRITTNVPVTADRSARVRTTSLFRIVSEFRVPVTFDVNQDRDLYLHSMNNVTKEVSGAKHMVKLFHPVDISALLSGTPQVYNMTVQGGAISEIATLHAIMIGKKGFSTFGMVDGVLKLRSTGSYGTVCEHDIDTEEKGVTISPTGFLLNCFRKILTLQADYIGIIFSAKGIITTHLFQHGSIRFQENGFTVAVTEEEVNKYY